jgi:hypothetical protein
MAQCALCKDETEIYAGGDVPICVECSDARKAKGVPSVGEQPIRAALLQDFRDAAARNDEASREFQAVMGRLPSVLRQPQRINNASCNLTIARKRMMMAHRRLNDYLVRGVVPADCSLT